MKIPYPIAVVELAEMINAKLIGDSSLEATGINEIHQVENGDISFVDVDKYYKKALHSEARADFTNVESFLGFRISTGSDCLA